jgi:hypothetical protein
MATQADEQKRELFNKELNDAQRRAKTYGLPFIVFRGQVHWFDGEHPDQTVTEATQMLWDALA